MSPHAEAFFAAIRSQNVDEVRRLLDEDGSLATARIESADGEDSFQAIHLAAYVGCEAIERLLVERGADINARTKENRTALHVALECNNTTTEALLELGSEVDMAVAAALGRLDRIRELLDQDAALVNDPSTGLSPLGWSAYFATVEVAKELLARGARLDDGAILCAGQVNAVEVGRAILDAGAHVDAFERDCDHSALHAAATLRHTRDATPFARMLIEAGADVNLRASNGWTPLDLALEFRNRHEKARLEDPDLEPREYEAMIALLKENGALSSRT